MRLISTLVLFWLFASPLAVAAQESQSDPEAKRWFALALSEKDTTRKIRAYQRALEHDPRFVEAGYNLGMLHKLRGEYIQAESRLRAAFRSVPAASHTTMRAELLYELGRVLRDMGKTHESLTTLREARASASDAGRRSQITYEIARILYDRGSFAAAIRALNSEAEIPRDLRAPFDQLLTASRQSLELQTLYDQASDAAARGDVRGAYRILLDIREKDRGFRDVEKRIGDLQLQVEPERAIPDYEAAMQRARKLERNGNYTGAITIYQDLQVNSAQHIQDRSEELKKRVDAARKSELAKREFLAGEAARKAKNWAAALLAFERVVQLEPENKPALRRMENARKMLSRESARVRASQFYSEAMAALRRNAPGEALIALERVREIDPDYENTRELISDIESSITNTAPAPAAAGRPGVAYADTDSIYAAALDYILSSDWDGAEREIGRLASVDTRRHDLMNLLNTARNRERARGRVIAERKSSLGASSALLISGIVATVLVLPLLAYAAISPAVRARLLLLRGDYGGAASIYERMLEKNPGNLKICRALAHLYVLTGRKDRKAIELFRTILLLKIPLPWQEKIESMVRQQYLRNGGTGRSAIDLFEQALRQEKDKGGTADDVDPPGPPHT